MTSSVLSVEALSIKITSTWRYVLLSTVFSVATIPAASLRPGMMTETSGVYGLRGSMVSWGCHWLQAASKKLTRSLGPQIKMMMPSPMISIAPEEEEERDSSCQAKGACYE